LISSNVPIARSGRFFSRNQRVCRTIAPQAASICRLGSLPVRIIIAHAPTPL
jgi:hypothetical protein